MKMLMAIVLYNVHAGISKTIDIGDNGYVIPTT